jgi:hypothetical protein
MKIEDDCIPGGTYSPYIESIQVILRRIRIYSQERHTYTAIFQHGV